MAFVHQQSCEGVKSELDLFSLPATQASIKHAQWARVTKANGNNIDPNTDVGPVNNWMHSLFSQVDVTLNGTLVTPSTNTYPYRAYIETLLSHGKEAKQSQLTSCLWFKDTAGHMDATDDANAGFRERKGYAADGRVVDMMGRLHLHQPAFPLTLEAYALR